MWHIEASAESTASPQDIWQRYSDVSSWTSWDHEMTMAELDGPFVVGARGRLKPAGAPTFDFVLTRVEPNRRFSDRTPVPHRFLPLVLLDFDHEIVPTSSGVRITHRVAFRGPFGWLFRKLAGDSFRKDVPAAVESLAKHAAR